MLPNMLKHCWQGSGHCTFAIFVLSPWYYLGYDNNGLLLLLQGPFYGNTGCKASAYTQEIFFLTTSMLWHSHFCKFHVQLLQMIIVKAYGCNDSMAVLACAWDMPICISSKLIISKPMGRS